MIISIDGEDAWGKNPAFLHDKSPEESNKGYI
jgi:hypothetical protein